MNDGILLSVCIPTYNQASCLKDTINSVLLQLNNNIELVISDNASDDNTRNIVKDILDTNGNKNITYFRNESNLGLDGNILNLVNLAKGKYILFLGDDVLLDGALAYISGLLTHNVAMIFLNYQYLSLGGDKIWCFADTQEDLYFTDKNKFLDFLRHYVAFISATLINRALACEAIDRCNLLRFKGKSQMHYYISLAIASIKPQNFDLIFIAQLCVSQRHDPNLRWSGFNVFGTGVIEVFKNIREFGYDYKITKKIINMILIDLVFRELIVTIWQGKVTNDQINIFFKNVYQENKDNIFFWLLIFPVFCVPKSIIRFVYGFYRKCKCRRKATCKVYLKAKL